MNKKQFEKYKKEFIQWYGSHENHFYVIKAKTYSIESLKKVREGLRLLSNWFIDRSIPAEEQKHFDKFVRGSQTLLSKLIHLHIHGFQIWNNKTQLYYTYLLEKNNLISAANRPPDVYKKYQQIFREISDGVSYDQLERKHGRQLLNDIAANARNFKNMFSQLGFAWMEKNVGMFITSTGDRLIEDVKEDAIEYKIREIMEKQATKWQLNNPTAPSRYKELEIFPFIFLLELFLKLDKDKFISKLEYALIVSRARSMDELDDIHKRLIQYRSLNEEEKQSLKKDVERIKRERRNLLKEILDSATKELSFFGSTLSCRYGKKENVSGIYVANEKQAKNTLKEIKDNRITFIDFERKDDWFNYFGEWEDSPTQENAVDYLLSTGKKEKVKKIVELEEYEPFVERTREAIQEHHIEDYYFKHLTLLESGLQIYQDKQKIGRQFPTEVGRIDLLCIAPDGQFVVVEFKKGKTSDKIMGQLFRYMGWVYVNLSGDKAVRGIIVARDFDYKLKYAVKGVQYPEGHNLLKIFKHQFAVEEIPTDDILNSV